MAGVNDSGDIDFDALGDPFSVENGGQADSEIDFDALGNPFAPAAPRFSPELIESARRLKTLESSPESTDNLTEQIRRSKIELARKDFDAKAGSAGLLTQAAKPAIPESGWSDIFSANNATIGDRLRRGFTGAVEAGLSWIDSATTLQDQSDKGRAIALHGAAIDLPPAARTPEQRDLLEAVYGRADITRDDADFDFGGLDNFISRMEYGRQSRDNSVLDTLRKQQAGYSQDIGAVRDDINVGDSFTKEVVDSAYGSAQEFGFDLLVGRLARGAAGGKLAGARGADAAETAARAAIRAKALTDATKAGALGSMAARVYGQTREEGIAEGLSPAEAEARARWHTATEWATELLPLDMILKGKLDQGVIRKALKATGAEGASEIIATGLQSGYDHLNVEGREITLGELVDQMAVAGAAGALVGGGLSVAADATGTSVKAPEKAVTADDVMREIGERYKASPAISPDGYSAVDAEMRDVGAEVSAVLAEIPSGTPEPVKYRTVRELLAERGITLAKAPRTMVERLIAAHRGKRPPAVAGGTEGDITELGADLRSQAGLDETVVDEPVAKPRPVRFGVDENIEPQRQDNDDAEIEYLQRAAGDLDELGRVDRKSFNPDFHSLSDAVAFEGGLDRAHLGGEVDIKTANAARVGRPVVRKEGSGLTPDHMAERLHELGFRAPGGGRLDPNSLMELLADEAIGRQHFSTDKAYTGRFDEDRGFVNMFAGGDPGKLAGAIRKYLAGGDLGINQRRALKAIIEVAYETGELRARAPAQGNPQDDGSARALPIAQALADAGFEAGDQQAVAAAREALDAGMQVEDIAQAIRAAGGDPAELDVTEEQIANQLPLSPEDRAVESAAGQTAAMAQAASRLSRALVEVAKTRKGRAMRAAGAAVPKRNAVNFRQPYDQEVDASLASAGEAAWKTGATPEQAAAMFDALFPRAHVDATTGFYKAEQRFQTAQRAIEYVNNSRARGFYVEIDLSNLGGLNAKLGHSEANKVYRRMAGIVANMLSVRLSKGDPAFDQVNFRHGGDEMSFFVFGENIDRSSIEAVLRSAQERVWTYARSVGIHEIPHAKQKDNEQKIGVNFYFGVARIEGTGKPDEFFSEADTQVEKAKKEPGYGYRKREEARSVRPDGRGEGEAAAGNLRGGGQAELAGETGAPGAGAPGEAGAAGGAGRDGDAEVRLEAGQAGRDPALDEAGGKVEERRRGDDRTTDLFGGKTAEEEAAQRLKDAEVEKEAKQKRDAERAEKMSDGPLFDGTADQADALTGKKEEPAKPDETEASAVLDAADVRGKDRLDAMEKFRAGTYTLDDLKAAYPAKSESPAGAAIPESAAMPGDIQDFGEKLGGARKDKAAAQREAIEKEFSDEEIATLPLSKIWPKGEVDDIEDTYAAAVAHAARQEVPAKPRQTGKVRIWVQKVKIVRGLAQYILRGTVSKERFDEMLRAGGRSLEHFAAKVELLQAIDRAQWDRIGSVEQYPDAYTYGPGSNIKIPAPLVAVEIDGRRKRYEGAKSVADAMDAIRADLGEAAAEKQMKFEVRGSNEQWRINKVGDPLYRPLKTFSDSKEALAYVRNNNAELVAAWEALKERQNVKQTDVRRDTNRQRTAKDWRAGKDVTPQQFVDEFGFRGVEFGNWVGQGKSAKERQGMLNDAYDALNDLADIVGVPPKAISLSGSLGLGFGSRGSGWASAHFEPGTLVINLTKTRGAGALAHEWFHALDNHFQRKRGEPKGKEERDYFITYAPENYYIHKQSGLKIPEKPFEIMVTGGRDDRYGTMAKRAQDRAQWEFKTGVRTEVAERFAELVKALNDSPMAKRARRIDKGKSDGYWSSIIEMGARAFENYVIHKMMLKGYQNDYLANVVAIEDFQRDADRYPYLTAGELQPVAEAFDALFATMKTRTEPDGRVAIYEPSRGYDGDAVRAKRKEVDSGKAKNLQRRRVSAAQEQGDLFSASAVPAGEQRAAAVADIYHVTVEHEEVGRVDVGHQVVDTPEKVAWALRHLGRRAQEQMLALVTDKDGKPVSIISHTTGLRTSSQVDAGGIAGAIVSQPGARNVWLAHNHPGGDPSPSSADRAVTNKIADLLSGSGVVTKGHVVVGAEGDAWMFTGISGGEPHGYRISAKRADSSAQVSVVERVITRRGDGGTVNGPTDAERIAAGLQGDGVMLLDSRHRVVGFVPLTSEDMASLRTSDPGASTPLYRLLAAMDKTNADALIIAGGKREAAENVEKFGNAAGIRVLDWISGGKSKGASGEFGDRFAGEAFLSQSKQAAAGGASVDEVRGEIDALKAAIPGLDVEVVQSVDALPAYIVDHIDRLESRGEVNSSGIEGVFDPVAGRCYVVADNLSSAQRGAAVALHENVAHFGTRVLLGERHEAVMLEIERSFRGRADFEEIRNRYQLTGNLDRKARAKAADEFVARLAESGTLAAMAKAKPLGPVARLFRAIREILQRIGLVDWNDADIERLLARAVDAVNRERAAATGERDLSFALSGNGKGSDRQFRDTERAYGGKSAYEKAKAEGRTKLNYRQWVQVRTPNFKNWFGDWEAVRAQERLDATKSVQVRIPDDWRGLPVDELRGRVREVMQSLRDEPLQHPEIGEVQVTGNTGIKKSVSEGRDPAKLFVLGDLRLAFESSLLASASPPKSSEPGVSAYEKLLANVDVGGTEMVAVFTVRRMSDGRQFYNTFVLEDGQKKTPVVSPRDTPIYGERATSADTGVSDFVRRQLNRVNPEGVSKVIDPTTGEPLVVYHGTDASFDEFAIPGGPEPGVFFTPSAVDASDYSERFGEYADSPNVMPVFLSMPGARVVDGKGKTFSIVNKEAFTSGNADGLIIRNVIDGFSGAGDVYIAARDTQIKSATGNNGDFDLGNPDISFSLSGAGQHNANTVRAGKEARANKGEWDALYEDVKSTQAMPEAASLRDRVRAAYAHLNRRNSLAFRQGFFDSFASIGALEVSSNGTLLDAGESAYKAALLTKNLSGVMASILYNKQIRFDGKWFIPDEASEGFASIFEPLAKEPGLLRLWEHWAGAVRAKRLLAEGRERNYSQEQVDRVLAFVESRPELAKLFNETHRRWRAFNRRTLDMAEAAGVVDPEERKLWENDDYVPFHRIIEDQEDAVAGRPLGRRGLEGQSSGIRRLTGSDAKVNILESMVMNTMHLVDASMKNVAMQRVADLAEGIAMEKIDLGWKPVEFTDGQLAGALKKHGVDVGKLTAEQRQAWSTLFTRVRPQGADVVSVMRDGKREWYRVTDPLLMRAVTAMGPEPFKAWLEVLGIPKRVLTTLVTADPGFMVANFLRDTLSTWVTVKPTGLPREYRKNVMIDAVRGGIRSMRNSDDQWKLMAAGATGEGFYRTQPADVRDQLREIQGLANTLSTPMKAWTFWQKVGRSFENANRLAVFENVKKAGGSDAEAAYQAMDVLNFSRRGEWEAVRILTAVVPFLNARIQGLDRLYRGARENPASFAMKGAALTAATMLLMAANDDDERYWSLPEWDRDTYWHFWIGGEHFRIPKPFEVGALFATIPERAWAYVKGKDDGGDVQEAATRMLVGTFAFNPIPQAFLPAYDVARNESTFRQSPIMPSYMADYYAPEDQYDVYTSETMRWLADAMPDSAPDALRSPKSLEYLMKGYFGTLGSHTLNVADSLTRRAMDMPVSPEMTPSQYPLVGRFWRKGDTQTKFTEEFYEMLGEAERLHARIKKLKEEGLKDKSKQAKQEAVFSDADLKRMQEAQREMAGWNDKIKAIYASDSLDASAKRQKIAVLQDRRNQLAKRMVEKFDQ